MVMSAFLSKSAVDNCFHLFFLKMNVQNFIQLKESFKFYLYKKQTIFLSHLFISKLDDTQRFSFARLERKHTNYQALLPSSKPHIIGHVKNMAFPS